MTVIFNTVQDAGAPIPGAEVRITLIRVPAYHEPDEFTVVASHRLAADQDGYWEIELTPNAEFDPDNTFYRVVEANKVTHEILVEDWPYPVWLGDVLEPGGAPASLPTLHSGQFDAHGATSSATPDRIVRRDGDGRAQVADPAVAADIATRGWTEGEAAGQVAAHEAADPAHPAGNVSFSPSGLAIVTTDRVQAAIAELDAWADDAESGLLSAYVSADGAALEWGPNDVHRRDSVVIQQFNLTPALSFPSGSAQRIEMAGVIPPEWEEARVVIEWTATSGTAGDTANFQMLHRHFAEGADLSATGTFHNPANLVIPDLNRRKRSVLRDAFSVGAGNLFGLRIQRNTGDTLSGAALVMAVRLERADLD